jgi:hypothetical protein
MTIGAVFSSVVFKLALMVIAVTGRTICREIRETLRNNCTCCSRNMADGTTLIGMLPCQGEAGF